MLKPPIQFVLISCCTCKRPIMLKKSLESVRELVLPEDIKIELLVIDNDKDASAKTVIDELSKDFPIKINYFVEEQRGISNARNRLLKEAINFGATHIALFDDDELLDKNWISSHINYYKYNSEAFIISGPTYNEFEKDTPRYIRKNRIFKSSTTKKTGLVRSYCASGNVFFPTNIMSDSDISFDANYVFMGGEDGDFFSRASKAGYTIVWNNDAINYEIIGHERANLKWIMGRNYYNGYSGSYLKHKDSSSTQVKTFYLLKHIIILPLNVFLSILAIFFGATVFFNMLGLVFKTKGKIDAVINQVPINYYENISGH